MNGAETPDLVTRYLKGERDAVRTIDAWIEQAAGSFRKRLAWQWDDVTQAARTEINRLFRAGTFRGESSPRTYLWRVVNHICIDHVRALKRAPSVDINALAETEPSGDESPLDRVLRQESVQVLLEVLESMPADCRRLWALIVAGRSYSAISRELGTSEGALRVKLLRCRRKAIAVKSEMTGGSTRQPA